MKRFMRRGLVTAALGAALLVALGGPAVADTSSATVDVNLTGPLGSSVTSGTDAGATTNPGVLPGATSASLTNCTTIGLLDAIATGCSDATGAAGALGLGELGTDVPGSTANGEACFQAGILTPADGCQPAPEIGPTPSLSGLLMGAGGAGTDGVGGVAGPSSADGTTCLSFGLGGAAPCSGSADAGSGVGETGGVGTTGGTDGTAGSTGGVDASGGASANGGASGGADAGAGVEVKGATFLNAGPLAFTGASVAVLTALGIALCAMGAALRRFRSATA